MSKLKDVALEKVKEATGRSGWDIRKAVIKNGTLFVEYIDDLEIIAYMFSPELNRKPKVRRMTFPAPANVK